MNRRDKSKSRGGKAPALATSAVHKASRKWYLLIVLSPAKAIKDRFLNYAGELRFPRLLMLTLVIFSVDLVVPDFIPFVDEILLGLFAALLAMVKKKRRGVIDVQPVAPAPPDVVKPQ